MPALAAVAAVLALLVATRTVAAEPPIPPSPAQWVTDNASFLSSGERDQLDAELEQYEQSTGHQVIVWIGQTTGETPLEEYTINAFTKWKVGRKGLDDGAVLFVFAQDRKLRIEVGYGLEPTLTDARSSEIIRDIIVPKIRAGDDDGAIQSGVDAMLSAIGGSPAGSADQGTSEEPALPAGVAVIGVVLFVLIFGLFVYLGIRYPAFAAFMLYTLASGRGGGGGWGGGGGGGFSGGGGGGGGGGASGGW